MNIYQMNIRCLSVSSRIGGGVAYKRISLYLKKKKKKKRWEVNEYCFEIFFILCGGGGGGGGWGKFLQGGKFLGVSPPLTCMKPCIQYPMSCCKGSTQVVQGIHRATQHLSSVTKNP